MVLMVVDGRAGVRVGDAELAKTLRGAEVPVVVVVNKVDQAERLASPRSSTGSGWASRCRSRPATARQRRPARRVVDALGDRPPRPEDEEPVRVA